MVEAIKIKHVVELSERSYILQSDDQYQHVLIKQFNIKDVTHIDLDQNLFNR